MSEGQAKRTVKCQECGNQGVKASDGVCVFCAGPNEEVVSELTSTLEDLVDEHGLATVFWSLDAVYDDYDDAFGDLSTFEVPIFEAKVIVPDHNATSGARYETRRIDGCLSEAEAREEVRSDPEVRSIETIEQVDTAVVA